MEIAKLHNQLFCSGDIKLCAFLLCKQVELIEVVETSPNRYSFVLSNPEKCNELKKAYLNGAEAAAGQLFYFREILLDEVKNQQRYGGKP